MEEKNRQMNIYDRCIRLTLLISFMGLNFSLSDLQKTFIS